MGSVHRTGHSVFRLCLVACLLFGLGCFRPGATLEWEDYGEISSDDADVLAEARQYNLERINAYREAEGLAPLVLDEALNAFSQAATEQLSRDRTPHRYFDQRAKSCACGVVAQNQGRRSGNVMIDLRIQIDDLLAEMMAESPGRGHRKNILAAEHRRLGAGFLSVRGVLYLTNDFGR